MRCRFAPREILRELIREPYEAIEESVIELTRWFVAHFFPSLLSGHLPAAQVFDPFSTRQLGCQRHMQAGSQTTLGRAPCRDERLGKSDCPGGRRRHVEIGDGEVPRSGSSRLWDQGGVCAVP